MDAEARVGFEAFVSARSPALFRTALALTGHRQQAEDLLQTALVRTARHWSRVADGHPEAYVRTVLYRQQMSWWRGRGRRPETPTADLPELPGPDQSAVVDLRLQLAAALRRLAPKHRAVLTMRFYEDLPTEEIARVLNCTPSTVRSQTSRALRRLRELCPELDASYAEELHR